MMFIQIQVEFKEISKKKETNRGIYANRIVLIQGLS